MNRLLKWLCLMAMPCLAGAATRPNIIFIMTDDHASHALSCYGSKVNQTPHLDRLAQEGMMFQNAFVPNSICTPSRAAILTGQYSHLNGVPVFNRFDAGRDHVAKHLQASGYQTAMIGKWHLGADPTGFDQWIVLPGQGAYHNPAFLTPHGRLTPRTTWCSSIAFVGRTGPGCGSGMRSACSGTGPEPRWKWSGRGST
jgi:arylsulfatase A-like enzyme